MSLFSVLPAPRNVWDRDEERAKVAAAKPVSALVVAQPMAPPYGMRKGWVPRTVEDFGDGGSFPEIQVAQYPLNMAKKGHESSSSNALALQLDNDGKVKYDLIARQGHSKDKVIYTKLRDLLPSEVLAEEDKALAKPSQETIEETVARTRAALRKIIESKTTAAMPVRYADKKAPAQFIRYTPVQQGTAFNSGAKERVIRMVELQRDPMEPPRFKINKKIPRGPPSPPAPVLHSPPRRLTVQEQKAWKIPPCISNWKNPKGYTIPLDKRIAADGRGLQQVHINEKFGKLAEALNIAEKKARGAVELRARLEQKLAEKEKQKIEENLKVLARRAREETKATFRPCAQGLKKNQLRYVRRKKLREKERDISEAIALGMPAKTAIGSDPEFDTRLYNMSSGMGTGYVDDDDDAYDVYDRRLRCGSDLAQHIYRPDKNIDRDVYGDEIEKIINKNRFVPDKPFSGTEVTTTRSGPVNFEKEKEVDPFGLDQFFKAVKRASKRPNDDRQGEKDKKCKKQD